MSERYKAVEGSESAHCCFEAAVVDTQTPHPMFAGNHDWVCECYDMETAQKIADALNAAQQPAEQKPGVAQLVGALEALRRARRTAMEQAIKARIPECAEFAGIAQDLDFVAASLEQEPSHDQ